MVTPKSNSRIFEIQQSQVKFPGIHGSLNGVLFNSQWSSTEPELEGLNCVELSTCCKPEICTSDSIQALCGVLGDGAVGEPAEPAIRIAIKRSVVRPAGYTLIMGVPGAPSPAQPS